MKQITVQELDSMLRKLGIGIKEVVKATEYDKYEDWSCIRDYDKITDPDELQLLDEYQNVCTSCATFTIRFCISSVRSSERVCCRSMLRDILRTSITNTIAETASSFISMTIGTRNTSGKQAVSSITESVTIS